MAQSREERLRKRREAQRRKYAEDTEYRERLNERNRRRYAEDAEFREKKKARDRLRAGTPEAREHNRQGRQRRAVRNRALVAEFKQGRCAICGEADPRCLVGHHKNPSTKGFNLGSTGGRSLEAVRCEIAKCEVLCASCHAKVDAGGGVRQGKSALEAHKLLNEILEEEGW